MQADFLEATAVWVAHQRALIFEERIASYAELNRDFPLGFEMMAEMRRQRSNNSFSAPNGNLG